MPAKLAPVSVASEIKRALAPVSFVCRRDVQVREPHIP